MWTADKWNDYEVLETSGGEKLERWGKYLLVRPDPQVIWQTKRPPAAGNIRTDIITAAPKAGAAGTFLICPKPGRSPMGIWFST